MRKNQTQEFHATFTGRGEFYSGIRNGERVLLLLEITTYTDPSGDERQHVSRSIQSLEKPGAWLGLTYQPDELSEIVPITKKTTTYYDPTPGYCAGFKKEYAID